MTEKAIEKINEQVVNEAVEKVTTEQKPEINPSDFRQTCVSFRGDVIQKADLIVSHRLIPGVTNRSGLIDYALKLVFKELKMEG